MIIQIYEDYRTEVYWVGELEDLLEANQEIPDWQRKELRKLQPGQGLDLEGGFRAKRPEEVKVPIIPPTPQEQLDFEAAQEAAWEKHTKFDMEAIQKQGDMFLRRSNFIDGFAYGWGARGKV